MIQVLSKKKKDFLACCTYVTEVEFEVAEDGQPTRWLCYSDADFAGFIVTDRSAMMDESKPTEYYQQMHLIREDLGLSMEEYEDLETAKGSKYYDLFAQMQEIAEES